VRTRSPNSVPQGGLKIDRGALEGNRRPVGFAKAYLSGFYETAVEFKGILMFLHS
jgi:hypothetical protein